MRLRLTFLGSRVARRVFWLYVLSTLVPLALSDWLATSIVSDLAREDQERSQVQSTRQTALQVFSRLATAKVALESLPADPAAPASPGAGGRPSSYADSLFVAVAAAGQPVRADDGRGPASDVLDAWQRADSGADGDAPVARAAGATSEVTLRIAAVAGAAPRVLLGLRAQGELRRVAELRPAYLWGPLADTAIDRGWLVTDARGRVLASEGDAELIPPLPGQPPAAATGADVYRTSLFLAPDFSAGEWEFAQKTLSRAVLWHGAPLGRWLALVAGATMLVIALISLRLIRRTLVPLEVLTVGTRRLASASSTRVQIAGSDEFAALGQSFNEMAERIEAQFRSLEGLAAIDHDVLAGTPIEVAAARVVEQLGSAHPALSTMLVWIDDEPPGRLLRLSRAPGPDAAVGGGVEAASADAAPALAGLAEDRVVAEDASLDPTWALPAGDGSPGRTALLPLRWDAATRAALVLRGPADDVAAALKSAGELRERLAVAFSARARDKEMVRRAGHDSLTGLVNRHGLNEFVDAMLAPGQAPPAFAILFVDIDNFKIANDSLGHEVGDVVLCEAGRRLAACTPAGTLVARQGGDEFVLVLPTADEPQACEVAARAVQSMAVPFPIGNAMHTFGASVGIALCPTHGATREELLRRADMAMYDAKAGGRSRYALFHAGLEAATQRRLRLPKELRRALERGELSACYQARVRPGDGAVTSAEALVRWQHPERGLLLPASFIALAEESDLIADIGFFMLEDACSRIGAWQRRSPTLQRVSVNVSPRQLVSGDLPGMVASVLKRHALAPQSLELEVTESLLVDNARDAHAQLAELRRLGVSIALDDFGTGYSSMAMLRNLPIDVMKIDRAFVKDLDVDPGAVAITRTISTLARALGLHLVAEGVETQGQATLLQSMGCDELQGYLYSKALTPEAFARYCRSRADVASVAA